MANFSKVTISPEAAGMGETLAMLALMTELQQKQYDALKAGVQTEGQAANALGKAAQASLQASGASTNRSAWASIASGATTIGAESTSVTIGGVRSWRNNSNAQEQLENTQNWEGEIKRAQDPNNGVGHELQELNAKDGDKQAELEEQNAIKDRLREGQKNLKKFGDRESAQLKEDIQAAGAKQMNSELEEFQKGIDKKSESIMNEKAANESRIDRMEQRFSSIGQAAGSAASGFFTMQAASQQYNQANQELLSKEAEFVYQTMKQANQTAESLAQATENNKNSLIRSLMEAMAGANHV